MIKILYKKSKNFEKKLEFYLNLRRKYPYRKTDLVKKILNDIRKTGDKSLLKYEKKFNNLKVLNKDQITFTNLR